MLSATVGLKKKTDRFRLINYQPGYCEKEVRKSVWEHLKRSWVFVARRLIEMEIGWGIIGGGKKLTLPLCLLFFFPNFFGLLLCTTVTTLATSGMWVFSPTPSSSLWHQLMCYNLSQLWHRLPGESTRSYKLSVQSHETSLHLRWQFHLVVAQDAHSFHSTGL